MGAFEKLIVDPLTNLWPLLRDTHGLRFGHDIFLVKSVVFWDITQHRVVILLPTFRDNVSVPSSRRPRRKAIFLVNVDIPPRKFRNVTSNQIMN